MTHQMHPAVILLLENDSADRASIREWFEESRFRTCDAGDVFEAMEFISDFTVRDRPDVVLLPVASAEADYDLVCELLETAPGEVEHPVIALSRKKAPAKHQGNFEESFNLVAARLENIIPRSMSVSA